MTRSYTFNRHLKVCLQEHGCDPCSKCARMRHSYTDRPVCDNCGRAFGSHSYAAKRKREANV